MAGPRPAVCAIGGPYARRPHTSPASLKIAKRAVAELEAIVTEGKSSLSACSRVNSPAHLRK